MASGDGSRRHHDGNSVTGVVQIAARVPSRQHDRLCIAALVLGRRPDFIVTGLGKLQLRRPVLPGPRRLTGRLSEAFCQVTPKLMETSIFLTRISPAQAWPRNAIGSASACVIPDFGKVISDFTGMDSMMHMSSSATAVPGATGVQGTR